MPDEAVIAVAPDIQKVFSMIDQVFLLPPQTKKELKEVFPQMPDSEKQEFLAYINSILEKQNEIISYLSANNPDFLSELKAFNASSEKKMINKIEQNFIKQDEMDMQALEDALQKL